MKAAIRARSCAVLLTREVYSRSIGPPRLDSTASGREHRNFARTYLSGAGLCVTAARMIASLGSTQFASRTPSVLFLFSTTPSLFLSPENCVEVVKFLALSRASLTEAGWFGPKISQILGQIGKMPGISRRTRVYLEITLRPPGYFVDFLNFASDFAPDQLSDSARENSEFPRNEAPNTLCFPWTFPETQSAGDPLFSFLFSGKVCTGQAPIHQSSARGHVSKHVHGTQLSARSYLENRHAHCGPVISYTRRSRHRPNVSTWTPECMPPAASLALRPPPPTAARSLARRCQPHPPPRACAATPRACRG